jgi:periplasmic protein TonB
MNKLIFTLLAIGNLYIAVQAQPPGKKADTAWFTSAHQKTIYKDSAAYFTVRNYHADDSNRVKMTRHAVNGHLLGEKNFSDFKKLIREGTSFDYFPETGMTREISYVNNKMEGTFITRWPDGKIKRRDIYRNDTLVSGQCYTKEGKDTAWFAYEQQPQFPGGQDSLRKFLWRNLKYPPLAKIQEIQGTVYVMFTVTRDGAITGIKLYKSVAPLLDAEAIRVVSRMPPWIPGKRDGEMTSFELSLPVVFRLE